MVDIFEMAREQAGWVTSAQFPDATLLKYAQKGYKKMQNLIIRKVNENYFYDILKANTVANQNEYVLKTMSGTVIWLKKVLTANIKRDWTQTYFEKLGRSMTDLNNDSIDEQAITVDYNFAQIKDGSLFVFPAPTVAVTDWLMIEAIVSLVDLTATDTEALIFPNNTELRDYHEIIAMSIVPYIFGKLKQTNEKVEALNEYKMALDEMIDELNDRFNSDLQADLPNGKEFK